MTLKSVNLNAIVGIMMMYSSKLYLVLDWGELKMIVSRSSIKSIVLILQDYLSASLHHSKIAMQTLHRNTAG